jgi:hypothetical protein
MGRDIEFHTHTKQRVKFSFTKSIIAFTYFNRRMANKDFEVNDGKNSPNFMCFQSLRECSFDFFTVVPKELNFATSHTKWIGVYKCNVLFIRAVVQHPLWIQRELLSFVMQAFVLLLISSTFSRIPFTSYMLSNDASRLRFNALSNE